ncbi:hypothetical protein FPSE5266_20241 [Fusarium pseudograminearum]|nr:hypothetical protein FPSE5266_20241 [Fusarium pseudograminearum]
MSLSSLLESVANLFTFTFTFTFIYFIVFFFSPSIYGIGTVEVAYFLNSFLSSEAPLTSSHGLHEISPALTRL